MPYFLILLGKIKSFKNTQKHTEDPTPKHTTTHHHQNTPPHTITKTQQNTPPHTITKTQQNTPPHTITKTQQNTPHTLTKTQQNTPHTDVLPNTPKHNTMLRNTPTHRYHSSTPTWTSPTNAPSVLKNDLYTSRAVPMECVPNADEESTSAQCVEHHYKYRLRTNNFLTHSSNFLSINTNFNSELFFNASNFLSINTNLYWAKPPCYQTLRICIGVWELYPHSESVLGQTTMLPNTPNLSWAKPNFRQRELHSGNHLARASGDISGTQHISGDTQHSTSFTLPNSL